jgi:hypothetical protein
MTIEEKFKNRLGWNEVLGLKYSTYHNLEGIDCLQEVWEKEGKVESIWFTFCTDEVNDLTEYNLIDLVFNPNIINIEDLEEMWWDEDGLDTGSMWHKQEGFTYLMLHSWKYYSETLKITKEAGFDDDLSEGEKNSSLPVHPRTKGTIPLEELLKPGKFYRDTEED